MEHPFNPLLVAEPPYFSDGTFDKLLEWNIQVVNNYGGRSPQPNDCRDIVETMKAWVSNFLIQNRIADEVLSGNGEKVSNTSSVNGGPYATVKGCHLMEPDVATKFLQGLIYCFPTKEVRSCDIHFTYANGNSKHVSYDALYPTSMLDRLSSRLDTQIYTIEKFAKNLVFDEQMGPPRMLPHAFRLFTERGST